MDCQRVCYSTHPLNPDNTTRNKNKKFLLDLELCVCESSHSVNGHDQLVTQ